jgi:hypothetical protein
LRQINPDYHKRQKANSESWHNKNRTRKNQYDKERIKKIGPRTEPRYFAAILKKYGVSKEKYLEMVAESKNHCYICGDKPVKGKRLHIDHDHNTLVVRGLLCYMCNWYMGKVDKKPEILNKIKTYLGHE